MERLLRDATIDDRNGHAASRSRLEEVRPDLQFHQQHAARTDAIERARRPRPEVERIEDDLQIGMILLRHLVPIGRRRRQHDLQIRPFGAQPRDDVGCSFDLPDRHAVDPHDRFAVRLDSDAPHSLAERTAIARIDDRTPQQYRRIDAESQQEGQLVDRHRQRSAQEGPRSPTARRGWTEIGHHEREPALSRTRVRSTSCT